MTPERWAPERLTPEQWDLLEALDELHSSHITLERARTLRAVLVSVPQRHITQMVALGSGKPPRALSRAERVTGTRGTTRRTHSDMVGIPAHPKPCERRRGRRAVWTNLQEQAANTRAHGYVHTRALRRQGFRTFCRRVGL